MFYSITFDVAQLSNSASKSLIQFLTYELHPKPVFIDGTLSLVEVAGHTKTNFVQIS